MGVNGSALQNPGSVDNCHNNNIPMKMNVKQRNACQRSEEKDRTMNKSHSTNVALVILTKRVRIKNGSF